MNNSSIEENNLFIDNNRFINKNITIKLILVTLLGYLYFILSKKFKINNNKYKVYYLQITNLTNKVIKFFKINFHYLILRLFGNNNIILEYLKKKI